MTGPIWLNANKGVQDLHFHVHYPHGNVEDREYPCSIASCLRMNVGLLIFTIDDGFRIQLV